MEVFIGVGVSWRLRRRVSKFVQVYPGELGSRDRESPGGYVGELRLFTCVRRRVKEFWDCLELGSL